MAFENTKVVLSHLRVKERLSMVGKSVEDLIGELGIHRNTWQVRATKGWSLPDIKRICTFAECVPNDLISPDSPVRFVD